MTNIESEHEVVIDIVRRFFDSWKGRSFVDHPTGCHPKALFFVKTSDVPPRSLSFIKALPDFVGIELESIQDVQVFDDQIASVHILYDMVEASTKKKHIVGKHSSILSLIRIDGIWMIVSLVDYGVEV